LPFARPLVAALVLDRIQGEQQMPMLMKKYEEEFRASLIAQRELGMRGDSWDNYALARTVLRDDLDKDNDATPYNIDEERRDLPHSL
jgi:hypothetical protein